MQTENETPEPTKFATCQGLKPFRTIDETTAGLQLPLEGFWNQCVALQPSDMIAMVDETYVMVARHYIATNRVLPLSVLNRALNKRWTRVLRLNRLPETTLGTFIDCLELSRSAPLMTERTARGGMNLYPAVLQLMIQNRVRRKEPINERAILAGIAAGPAMHPDGIKLAFRSFDAVERQRVEPMENDEKFYTDGTPYF